MEDNSAKEMKRRAEAALKRVKAAASKPHAPKGNAQNLKGNKVQPAKQRNMRQRGR